MKTAISVPDEIFESVTKWVSVLHVSRSEFFTRAAQRYMADLAAESLTDQIDAALALAAGDDSGAAAAARGRRLLDEAEGW